MMTSTVRLIFDKGEGEGEGEKIEIGTKLLLITERDTIRTILEKINPIKSQNLDEVKRKEEKIHREKNNNKMELRWLGDDEEGANIKRMELKSLIKQNEEELKNLLEKKKKYSSFLDQERIYSFFIDFIDDIDSIGRNIQALLAWRGKSEIIFAKGKKEATKVAKELKKRKG